MSRVSHLFGSPVIAVESRGKQSHAYMQSMLLHDNVSIFSISDLGRHHETFDRVHPEHFTRENIVRIMLQRFFFED
jgi:hypothetical protein